jgi:hypothetical protein
MLSTGSFNFIPYSLSGLQNINADTINGTVPFNGVVANTFYPLSYNTTTGILSQTPITQNINIGASPTFEAVYLNNVNQYIRNVSGGLTIFGNNSITVASGNTLNFLGSQIVFTGTGTGTSGGLMFNANANISCGSGLDLIFTTIDTADNILFVSGTTQKFKINNSGIYAPSLSSVSQTYLLGYNTSTGQITYQSPPTVPLSITVNNIASDSSNNLALSSANNNVNITAMSAIGGTGAGNINIYYKRYLSFYYDSSSVEIIRFQSTGIIFPNQTTTGATETPIRFTSTGPSYIQNNLGPVGFTCGGNNILSVNGTTSTGTINAIINNVNILKVSLADGLTTDKITSNTSTDLILNSPSAGILFNIAGTTYGTIDTNGLSINNIGSIAGQDLFLSSITGIIKTGASFTMYGGNLNLLDYATGLIQSQLFTDTTGLIIRGPTSKDIRLQIGFTNIMIADTSGITLQGSLPIKSATNTNLILNVPSSGYQMNLQHAGTTKAAITTNGLTVWNSNLYNAGSSLNIRNSTASTAYITLGNMDTVNNPFIGFVNTLGNNAGYLQSNYVSASVSNLYMVSTGTIEIESSATGSIIMDVGSTNLTIGSGGITTFGNIDITGTGQLSGLLTQNFPVNVYYQSTLTGPNNTVYIATGGFFTANGLNINSSMPSYINYSGVNYIANNWTPVWGTTSANAGFLYFPYRGVYTIDWSASFRSNINAMITINKNYNLANWSVSVPQNDITMLNKATLSPNTAYDLSCSATVRINTAGTSGDYVCFSIYNFSGAALFQLNAFRCMLNINKVG